jgi:hypothetical protein
MQIHTRISGKDVFVKNAKAVLKPMVRGCGDTISTFEESMKIAERNDQHG